MDASLQNQLIVKLFVGCVLTSEVRMHLHESPAWKQALIAPAHERDLVEIRFQGEQYLGRFVEKQELPLHELKTIEQQVRGSIQTYCPQLNLERLSCCVFPQIFLPG